MVESWQNHPFLALLRELLAVPSPPGREERMGALVRQKLTSMGYQPQTDPAGNVLVRIPGQDTQAAPMVIAAHIDEIAMVVTRIDPDGSLRVDRSGGLEPEKIGEGPVDIVGDTDVLTPGVLSFGSGHVAAHADRPAVKWPAVRVLTGLTPQQLADRGVRVGSTATPPAWRRGPVLLGQQDDPLVAAWTFDDRGGVVTLLRLLDRLKQENLTPARPLIAAFTVHEEGGCHGAKVLSHREKPEIFMALDGTPITPGSPLTADGRPCAWSKDMRAHCDQRLVQQLAAAARQAGTSLQTVVLTAAYSDATEVYNAGGAPRVVTFGHVRENSHGFEVTTLQGFDHVLETLSIFVTQLVA